MRFPRNLVVYELLPIEIRTLDFYNLESSAVCESFTGNRARIFDRANRTLFKRECGCFCSDIINHLDLEVFQHNLVTRHHFFAFSLWYLHLHSLDLTFLLKKDHKLALYAWTGDIMEELIHKMSLSENILTALSSVLKLIDKLDYCRYLPLDVILYYLKKYLSFAINKLNAKWDCKVFRKQVIDIVKVFVVRKDVYRVFIIDCPIELKTFLVCSQKENFEFADSLWSDSEIGRYEATHICLLHNVSNLSTFLQFGGKSRYSYSANEDLQDWFFSELGILGEKKFRILNNALSDENFKSFRLLQVFKLYIDKSEGGLQESVTALKWLWGSISYPFLTYEDFLHISEFIPDNQIREKFMQSWSWYKKHVSHRVQREPRSLLHLSRYVVRSMLAQSFNLPGGTKETFLPEELVHYVEMVDVNIE